MHKLIAGVDEVGRGPLVGDVVTAAVILDPENLIEGLTDSKKLSEKKRVALAQEIREKALYWNIGRASPEEIDGNTVDEAIEKLAEPAQEFPGVALMVKFLQDSKRGIIR